MNLKTIVTAACLVTAPAVGLAGCKKDPADAAAEASIKKLAVSELASLVEKKAVAVFDANGDSTREEYGVIPGAKLLSSSSDYDLSVLPASKSDDLVFYCANTRCSAAEGAAKRAVKAGYENVAVLPEGIKGWSKAGQKTAKIDQS